MRRVVWIDDNEDVYQQVAREWEEFGLAQTKLVYQRLPDETDTTFWEDLRADPPSILLLDWNEGDSLPWFRYLKDVIPTIIFVSWSPQDTLAHEGLFDEYPELLDRTLTKPFSAAQLAALLQFLSSNEVKNQPAPSLLDNIAIRYLNNDLVPFANTRAWHLDVNRPELNWSDRKKAALLDQGFAKHSLFCAHPTDPDKFGPVQFLTKVVPPDLIKTCPSGTKYYQTAFELPQEGAGLEEFGSSIMGMIHMMRQAGFVRGRYYQLADIPGLTEMALELVEVSPRPSLKLPLPASKELDTEEVKTFKKFVLRYQNNVKDGKNDEIIYEFIPPDKNFNGANTRFWNQYIEMDEIEIRLEIPIFLTKAEIASRKTCPNYALANLHGVFIFDTGAEHNPQQAALEKRVKALEPSLQIAIKYLQIARRAEKMKIEAEKASNLLKLHNTLIAEKSQIEIERDIVNEALGLIKIQNDAENAESPVRSAMFLEYDKFSNLLRVICETDELMTGFEFSLKTNLFASVKCALAYLNDGKSQPACHPAFDAEPASDEKIAAFKQIPQCTDSLLEKIIKRLKDDIKTVVSFPVERDGQLLGIVTLRSNRPYEFTSDNVQTIIDMLKNAAPYLERKRIDDNRKIWDGMVMHEMRANLSLALNKLYGVDNEPKIDDQLNVIAELKHVLKDGIALSSSFLDWLKDGKIEKKEVAVTNDAFWAELNEYGQYRENVSEWLKWQWHNPGNIVCRYPTFFGRTIRIIIDNAFRYADKSGDIVSCQVELDIENSNWVRIDIKNPGFINEGSARHFTNPSLTSPPINKGEIGLVLVQMMCHEFGGKLIRPENMKGVTEKVVVTTLFWPINS